MNKQFFDFNKLFEDYMRQKFAGKKDINLQKIREHLGEFYDEWVKTPLKVLDGASPSSYYNEVADATTLIEHLVLSCEKNLTPNAFLLEKIASLTNCSQPLREIVSKNENATLTLTAIELLTTMNAPQPLEDYVLMLKEGCADVELREVIIERLTQNADRVSESLYGILENADIELKTIIAEILICAKKDDRTNNLLTELFIESDNIPLISTYIGRYGDERMVSLLYKALDTCNYVEFLEVKNAIERMGGIVDDAYDFSEDAYYKLIKGEDNNSK